MVSSACYQVFRFGGIDKKHESKLFVEFHLMVKSAKGKEDVMKAYVYVIEADVTFFSWKKDFEKLGLNIKYKEKCFRDKKGAQKDYKMMTTKTDHYGVVLETQMEN